jgi:hypothetical protein
MGIWRIHFHWSVLLRWEVLGWILASLPAIAGLFLVFDQYQGANVCFIITALFLFAKVTHAALTTPDGTTARVLFTFALFGVIGVGIVETVKGVTAYATKKEKASLAPTLNDKGEKPSTPVSPTLEPIPAAKPLDKKQPRSGANSVRVEDHGTTDSATGVPGHHGTQDSPTAEVGHPSKSAPKAPPAQTSGLPLKVSLINPTNPDLIVENQTDSVAEGILWELVIFRTTDQAFFSYATQNIGYVKAHSKSAPQSMSLNALVQAPGGGGQIVNGDNLIGTLSIDCPTCSGTTLIVYFVWGSSGWFYVVPDGNGKLLMPKDLSKETVSRFIEGINGTVKTEDRKPIL